MTKTNDSIYRTPAYASEDEGLTCGEPKIVHLEGGVLRRKAPCPLPGWWDRFIHGVKHGEIFQCDQCHACWMWTVGTVSGRYWIRMPTGNPQK